MEFIHKVDPENNLRTETIKGVVDILELRKQHEAFYRSPEYDSKMSSLWDMRDADFSKVSPESVRLFADMVWQYWGRIGESKSALVVSDDLGFGLSRMLEMLVNRSSQEKVMVCKDIDKAHEWLNETPNKD